MVRATLKEVAKVADVSIAMVSRVLSGAADKVKPGTREAVITAREKSGCRLARTARRLHTRVFGRSKSHLPETVFSLHQNLYQDGWALSDALISQLKGHPIPSYISHPKKSDEIVSLRSVGSRADTN